MKPAQVTMSIAEAVEADPGGLLHSGDIVGDYRVERSIGSGGMAAVYSAVHCLLGQRVAIKVLKPASAAIPMLVDRFAREARALAHLDHRAIPRVITLGRLPSGRLYYVMELLVGVDLGAILRRDGPIAPEKALYILGEVARALEAAHDSGIVHRDLKPSNVFLSEDRSAPHGVAVKLLDFGIAKILEHARITEPPITVAGGPIVGTPLYMAPEQLRGLELDARIDIYGLGCLAYAMLAGRPPFKGKDLAELLRDKLAVAVEPLAGVNVKLAALEPPIRRAIAPDPDLRYPSPLELVEMLETAYARTNVPAEPSGDTTQTASIAPRAPPARRLYAWPAIAAAIALLFLLGLLAGRAANEPAPIEVPAVVEADVPPEPAPPEVIADEVIPAVLQEEEEKPRRVRAARKTRSVRAPRGDDASLELPIRF